MRLWKRLAAWLKRGISRVSAPAAPEVVGSSIAVKATPSTQKDKPLQTTIVTPPKPTEAIAVPTVALVSKTKLTPSIPTAKPPLAAANPPSSTVQDIYNSAKSPHRHQQHSRRKTKGRAKNSRATNTSLAGSQQVKPQDVVLPAKRKTDLNPIDRLLSKPDYFSWPNLLDTSAKEPVRAYIKGRTFEEKVALILRSLEASSLGKVTVEEQPKITLQNNEVVIPDFHLAVELAHERRHYIIECRDRERDAKDILHKIRHVRDKQRWQTFLFLYPKSISSELARALDGEGIMHLNLEDFLLFVLRLDGQLMVVEQHLPYVVPKIDLDKPKPDGAMLSSPPRRW